METKILKKSLISSENSYIIKTRARTPHIHTHTHKIVITIKLTPLKSNITLLNANLDVSNENYSVKIFLLCIIETYEG